MANTALNVLSLCSGIGGLDLGVKLAEPRARVVGHVEREAYAAAVLMARMADETLEPAPIWCGNLEDLDATPLHGLVDIVTAGFPCQPFSAAGKQRGIEDERWIWPSIADIIRDVEPSIVFLENVSGILIHGAGPVLDSLARLGFNAEWDSFTAAEVGAPHRRQRVFILAHAPHDNGRRREHGTQAGTRTNGERGRGPSGDGEDMANPISNPLWHERQRLSWRREAGVCAQGDAEPGDVGANMADANRDERRPDSREPDAGTNGRHDVGGRRTWPPPPNDAAGWQAYIQASGPQPAVRRGADGTAFRLDRLRCLGNAVVPAQAALAWSELWKRIHN